MWVGLNAISSGIWIHLFKTENNGQMSMSSDTSTYNPVVGSSAKKTLGFVTNSNATMYGNQITQDSKRVLMVVLVSVLAFYLSILKETFQTANNTIIHPISHTYQRIISSSPHHSSHQRHR